MSWLDNEPIYTFILNYMLCSTSSHRVHAAAVSRYVLTVILTSPYILSGLAMCTCTIDVHCNSVGVACVSASLATHFWVIALIKLPQGMWCRVSINGAIMCLIHCRNPDWVYMYGDTASMKRSVMLSKWTSLNNASLVRYVSSWLCTFVYTYPKLNVRECR